jgi:hypothetical protein
MMSAMPTRATGPFEVAMTPLAAHAVSDPTLGRRSLSKQLHGELEGTGVGEMLTAGTAVPGSAAYVAIERITGTLHGRAGSFVLQHAATLNRGAVQQAIAIVPDSGTGELAGIAGALTIRIVDGKHFYDLDYTLP